MKRLLIILIFLNSCYTETKKPDYKFMNTIKQQASLDSSLKTNIELIPKKYYFGKKMNSEKLKGFFYIKNIGNINFNIISIKSNCDCIITEYGEAKKIAANDSLKVNYEVNIKNQKGFKSNSIIAIGNCQFGNQTFYLEGTIY